jgi:hypothetical protein
MGLDDIKRQARHPLYLGLRASLAERRAERSQ